MSDAAKRSLGQHFLTDRNMIDKIIRHIAPLKKDTVVEIGPGKGALTRPLLESGCRLTALELDTRFASAWREKAKAFPDFRCIEGNALSLDWSPWLPCDKLVGNIPYNISRPLMFRIFEYRKKMKEAFLTVQKEFAEKMYAPPGTPSYGVVSVLTQVYCRIDPLFNVPPEVFSPPPHVMSACVHLRFRECDIDDERFVNIVRTAFTQRRKRLRNSLAAYYPGSQTDFPWEERADSIPPETYLRLL